MAFGRGLFRFLARPKHFGRGGGRGVILPLPPPPSFPLPTPYTRPHSGRIPQPGGAKAGLHFQVTPEARIIVRTGRVGE